MKKKTLIILLAFIMVIAFMPTTAFAGTKTVKMNAWQTVYKTGKTVYVAGFSGLYKVTVKKGAAKKVKKLQKPQTQTFVTDMAKKGNYLYFLNCDMAKGTTKICRVKTSGGKVKVLATVREFASYAIKGSKVYYSYWTVDAKGNDVFRAKVMKLNGKKKKNTKTIVFTNSKESNTKAYVFESVEAGNYLYDYLKTPKGKKKCLGKVPASYFPGD